jgi:hypothetical protein
MPMYRQTMPLNRHPLIQWGTEIGAFGAGGRLRATASRRSQAQLEDRASQSMRIAADFENFRKRTSKEKEELESKLKATRSSNCCPWLITLSGPDRKLSPKPKLK